MLDVTVVIVNYRTPKLTIGAVRSCLDEQEVSEVIVVDSASGDDSVELIWNELKGASSVRVLDMPENKGFGAANNFGVSKARNPNVFLLNSDAFVLEGCVGLLLDSLNADPKIGMVAPMVLESDGLTVQPRTFGPFPTLKTIFTRDFAVEDAKHPDWVSGVALMMRREEYIALSGFDEEFFMYFEDVDLCRRLRERGSEIFRDTRAKVVHFGGGSQKSDFKKKQLYYDSQDRYLELTGVSPTGQSLVRMSRWPAYMMRTVIRR